MYWGKPGAKTAARPGLTFMSAQGWAGVWHLEEAGAGKSGEYKDATGDYDGTGGGAIPARKEGMVGRSQDFKTTNSGSWITLPRTWDPGSSKFTLQMWIRREGPEEAHLFAKDGDRNDDERFELVQAANSGQLSFGRNGSRMNTDIYLPSDAWMLLGLVFDGTLVRFYVDGAERESHPFTMGGDRTAPATIGAHDAAGGFAYHGQLDEIWSSSRAKDAKYMRLIYENQKPWSNFVGISPL